MVQCHRMSLLKPDEVRDLVIAQANYLLIYRGLLKKLRRRLRSQQTTGGGGGGDVNVGREDDGGADSYSSSSSSSASGFQAPKVGSSAGEFVAVSHPVDMYLSVEAWLNDHADLRNPIQGLTGFVLFTTQDDGQSTEEHVWFDEDDRLVDRERAGGGCAGCGGCGGFGRCCNKSNPKRQSHVGNSTLGLSLWLRNYSRD